MIQGKVESHTKVKDGFRVGQGDAAVWYNIPPGGLLPDRFDVISFEYADSFDQQNRPRRMVSSFTVVEKGQAPNFAGAGGRPAAKSGYNSLGQQVGNCVTNAVNLVTSGKVPVPEGVSVTRVILETAGQLMQVGDLVESNHQKPAQAAPVAAAVQVAPPVPLSVPGIGNAIGTAVGGQPAFDDDIPFS